MLQAPVGATEHGPALPLIPGLASAAPRGLGNLVVGPAPTACAVSYSLSALRA